MLCEFSNATEQTVNPGESVTFNVTDVACERGFVRHRDGSGSFLLSGAVRNIIRRCPCKPVTAKYLVSFSADIAVPTGGTVGAITLAFSLDGSTIPASTMTSTPTEVAQYNNVAKTTTADVWRGCCETVSIVNTSDQPILVRNADIIFERPDLVMTY